MTSSAAPHEPIAAATVVLLRDGADELEVFLVERSAASRVLGGAHVFPGGKLDRDDTDAQWLARMRAPLAALHRALGEPELAPETAAGLFVAAARETFEEANVLLASAVESSLPDAGGPATASHRERCAIPSPPHGFRDALDAGRLAIDWSALVPWTRWITPTAPRFFRARYDARFFLAALPDGQSAVHDAHEAVASVWMPPRAALEAWWAGALRLVPAQILSLATLARATSVAEAISAARARPPPTIALESITHGELPAVVLPGDPRHASRSPVLPGPSLLVLRNGRFEPEGGLKALLD